jgi:hypothetical protein
MAATVTVPTRAAAFTGPGTQAETGQTSGWHDISDRARPRRRPRLPPIFRGDDCRRWRPDSVGRMLIKAPGEARMNRSIIALTLAVALCATASIAPANAGGGRGGGGWHGGGGGWGWHGGGGGWGWHGGGGSWGWHGGGWGWHGGCCWGGGWGWWGPGVALGLGLGALAAPYYWPPPVYFPPQVWAPPPQVWAPPQQGFSQTPQGFSQAPGGGGGQSCYAGAYVCPMERPVASGAGCYCPGNNGQRVPGRAS